ncbi:MAG TPA: serine/threonine-protein kinase [Pseudomonadota bacterium]|nr:serine/threonine-protein kinase [Pseudomonadota bacterium]
MTEAAEDRKARPVATDEILPGAIFCGRYKLQSELGRGGMGVVYRARDLALDRDVALKLVRNAGSPTGQRRFLREAKLASRVHHPHTVFVVDFGELPQGSCFLVMELLEGKTLAATLRECRSMAPLRVCRIGIMAASGLQSIHAHGIVHRDLKPANVFLLDKQGVPDFVKIVDFGVAKEVDDDLVGSGTVDAAPPWELAGNTSSTDSGDSGVLTRAGVLVGTPRYMAPEQLRGEPLDARVDQYALGCILYEMLTGEPPYSGDVQQVIRGHLYGELTPPLRHPSRPQSSSGLDAVIQRAMARRREDRFPAMQALAAALGQEAERLQGERPAGAVAKTKGRRVLGVSALVVATGLSAAAWRLGSPREPSWRGSGTGGAAAAARATLAEASSPLPAEVKPPEALAAPAGAAIPQPKPLPAAPAATIGPARLAKAAPDKSGAVAAGNALLAQAAAALAHRDLDRAAQLLESARGRCRKSPPSNTAAAASCALEVPLYQGRVYEATGHWPEALSAYSQVLDGSPEAPNHERASAWRSEAEVALARLLPRLGRVIVARRRAGRCEETAMILPPGEHVLDLDGEKRSITLHARETLRLETCSTP